MTPLFETLKCSFGTPLSGNQMISKGTLNIAGRLWKWGMDIDYT
jgi:hypothetical protein